MVKRIFIALILLLGALPAAAAAPEVWQCITADFRTASDNEDSFKRDNLAKTFEMIISDTEIIVRSFSDVFSDSEERYVIIQSKFSNIVGMGDHLMNAKIVVIPANRTDVVRAGGEFEATITIQGSFFINSWLLRCGAAQV